MRRGAARPPIGAAPPRGDGFEHASAADAEAVAALLDEVAVLRALETAGVDAVPRVVACDRPAGAEPRSVAGSGTELVAVFDIARGPRLTDLIGTGAVRRAGHLVTVLAPIAEVLVALHIQGSVHGVVGAERIRFDASGRPELQGWGTRPASGTTPADDWRAFGGVLDAACGGVGLVPPGGVCRALVALTAHETTPDARDRAARSLVDELYDWTMPEAVQLRATDAPEPPEPGANGVRHARSASPPRPWPGHRVRRRTVVLGAMAAAFGGAALGVALADRAGSRADTGGDGQGATTPRAAPTAAAPVADETAAGAGDAPAVEDLVAGAERLLVERAACIGRGDVPGLVALYEPSAPTLDADLAELATGEAPLVGAPVPGSVLEHADDTEHAPARRVDFEVDAHDAERRPASAVLVHGEAGWVLRSVTG